MKLLMVLPPETPFGTDTPRVFRAIGHELQKQGHTVEYFTAQESAKPWLSGTEALEQAIRMAPALQRACRYRRYDVVVTPASLGWCVSTFRKWLLPRKTKIVSWHCGQEEYLLAQSRQIGESERQGFPGMAPLLENMGIWAARQAMKTQDGCFLASTEERDWIHQNFPLESRKALYLPNGVSSTFYYPERQAETSHCKPENLLCVGPWDSRSGGRFLAEAFAGLLRQSPGWRLSLVNTGLAAEAILRDFPPETHYAVNILPVVDEKALPEVYQTHNIFISPATSGGMPLSILEAMASGMPVIATAITGRHDILTHYANGLLIPPKDAGAIVQTVNHLAETPDLCRDLGEAAYETVSLYYTWRQVSDIFAERLRQILHNKLPLPDWMMAPTEV